MESWRRSPDLVFHSPVWLSFSITGRPTIDEGGLSVIMRDLAVEKGKSLATSLKRQRRALNDRHFRTGAIPKCGHVALLLDCCYVNICVIFSSSGSLRMRLISQFSRASGARFSETDDSPETVVGRWILPAKLKALLGSSTISSQVAPGKDLMAESKSPLFGITPFSNALRWRFRLVSPVPAHSDGKSGSPTQAL